MQKFPQKTYFQFIVFMLMASTFLPLVFNNLPPVIKSHHIWTFIWGFSLLFFAPNVFKKKPMLCVAVYGLFLLLMLNTFWKDMDEWNTRMLIIEYYEIAVGFSVITYFHQSKDYISLAKITKWALIFLFITAVMSIISSYIDPMYARNIIGAAGIESESELMAVMSFQKYGGGGYGTAIAIMCLFPVLIYYYKNRRLLNIKKNNVLIFILTLLIALISMQIFTNVLVGILVLILSATAARNRIKTMAITGVILLLLVFIPKDYYVKGLYNLSDYSSIYEDLQYKLSDTALLLETGVNINDPSTAHGGRLERYPMLWESFKHSPLLGCYFLSSAPTYREEGGHLYWMNKLTTTGIIGLLIFLTIPLVFLIMQLKYLDKEYQYFFLLGAFALIFYGFFKAIGGREALYTFFIILPGMYYLPLLKK